MRGKVLEIGNYLFGTKNQGHVVKGMNDGVSVGIPWLVTGAIAIHAAAGAEGAAVTLRCGRLATGALALGCLYKGNLMRQVKTAAEQKNLRDYTYLSENESYNVSLDETHDVGIGRIIGAGLVLAGLAATARRPAAVSRAWNWFSKPSSRIQD